MLHPLLAATVATALLTASSASAQTAIPGSWASSQQIPEPNNALAAADLDHATLREIVHLSTGGQAIRIHLSNAFGTQPMHFAAVHVATPTSPASSAIVPGSDRAVLFGGSTDVTVPAGAEYLSDTTFFPPEPVPTWPSHLRSKLRPHNRPDIRAPARPAT